MEEEREATDKQETDEEECMPFSGLTSENDREKLVLDEVTAKDDRGDAESKAFGECSINMSGRLPEDVADLPEVINNSFRIEIVKAGPERFQNMEATFSSTLRETRFLYCRLEWLKHFLKRR